jgi:hypothetical protein
MAWVHARLCKLQKGCTRLATASDKVYQLLAHGRGKKVKSINHSLIFYKIQISTNYEKIILWQFFVLAICSCMDLTSFYLPKGK